MKKIIKYIKVKNLVIILGITIITIVLSYISIYLQKQEKNIIINDEKAEIKEDMIAVYFSGAVNSPGMYYFKENTRLEEALDIIGGIKQNADISKINLSKTLMDSEKIIIPLIQEKQTVELNSSDDDMASDIININKADERELMTLPGIGEVTAKKIIEYRKNGNFETIEDIKKVPGIGDSKYDKIKDKITVE